MGNLQKQCIIDQIISKKEKSYLIFENNDFIAFLDKHPLFLGHTLLAPKSHIINFYELPDPLVSPFFILAKQIATAVQRSMHAEGTFIAMNNIVSQSIPHLHLHIIPRTKGDGLKGFFWPRKKYTNEEQILETQTNIKRYM